MLRWFLSYLTGQIESVSIGNTTSSSGRLECGVPQGSILGPLLFILYAAPIQDIISAHNLDCMFYTDDSQLYITIHPPDQCPALNTLQKCISEIIEWNSINKLVCNPSKTRASDRSWKKKSNFAGFLGTNSRKNWLISREFSGKLHQKCNRQKTADFVIIFKANFPRNQSVLC